jgi:hypothetical protein
MLYWECKRRLALLRRFRVAAFDYFENIEYASWMAGGAPPKMNVTAQTARNEMNRMMGDVVMSFDLLSIPRIVFYQPPPISRGYAQNLDVILNVFDLYSFQLPTEKVFDCTDVAIGAYERECQKLLRKVFNPFYLLVIEWFPYHSKKSALPVKRVCPSQDYSFQLAKDALDKNLIVVGMRSRKRWVNVDSRFSEVPFLSSPRNPTVSIRSMGQQLFERIVEAFR